MQSLDRTCVKQSLVQMFDNMPADLCGEIARVCKDEEDAVDRMMEMVHGNKEGFVLLILRTFFLILLKEKKKAWNAWKESPNINPPPKNENIPLWWNEWWQQNYSNYKCTKDSAEAVLFSDATFKGMMVKDADYWLTKRLCMYVPLKGNQQYNHGVSYKNLSRHQKKYDRGNYRKYY